MTENEKLAFIAAVREEQGSLHDNDKYNYMDLADKLKNITRQAIVMETMLCIAVVIPMCYVATLVYRYSVSP